MRTENRSRTVEEQVAERFERNTIEHELTVLRDDGLYRHLRCKPPGTYIYGFDVVTWPGYLAIVGDAGDFVFSRIRDMFEFFENDSGRINPHYWAQKLQAPRQAGSEAYSADKYQQAVRDWQREFEQDELGIYEDPERTGRGSAREVLAYLDEIEFDWSQRDLELLVAFRDAVRQDLVAPWGDWQTSEAAAHRALEEFSFDEHGLKVRLRDTWEWDLRDYDHQFIWCCHAIVWAIARYREATAVADKELAHA